MGDTTGATELLRRVLAGDAAALRAMVTRLSPILEVRVLRALRRGRAGQAQRREAPQEIEDMVQETFLSLLDDDARALRAWKAELGLSFENFAGLIAERQVASILRSGRRSPWKEEPTEDVGLEASMPTADGPEARIASREIFQAVLAGLRDELSPRGLMLFEVIVVEQRAVEDVCRDFDMNTEAVYAWRSRLLKRARAIAAALESTEPPSAEGRSPRMPGGDQ